MTSVAAGETFQVRARAFWAWADDRLNPFLVKEARQLVRSKAVAGGQFLLLLALMGLVVAGVARIGGDDGNRMAGLVVFTPIHGAWCAVCIYLIPLYVGVRMACECTHAEGLDMLRGMTVPASRIVLGKWLSGFLLGILALSVFAPFLTLCYFLRGISLGMVLASVWVGCLQMAVGTLLALYAGSNGRGWAIKIAIALCYVLLSTCLVAVSASVVFIPFGGRMPGLWFGGMTAVSVGALVLGLVAYGLAVGSVKILLADTYARRYALERRAGAAGYWLGAKLRQAMRPAALPAKTGENKDSDSRRQP